MNSGDLFNIFLIKTYNLKYFSLNSIHLNMFIIFIIIFGLSFLSKKNNFINNALVQLWETISQMLETDKYPEYKDTLPLFFTISLLVFIINITSRLPGFVPIISLLKVSIPFYSFVFIYFLYFSIKNNGTKIINIFFNDHIILPIRIFIGFLEIFSYFLKIVIFSIRILANITAGHVLMAVIENLIVDASIYLKIFPFIFLVIVYLMEILLSFLQSYIFLILSTNIFKSVQKSH
jgi:F-type H+-transporting ATPase subunit a